MIGLTNCELLAQKNVGRGVTFRDEHEENLSDFITTIQRKIWYEKGRSIMGAFGVFKNFLVSRQGLLVVFFKRTKWNLCENVGLMCCLDNDDDIMERLNIL